MFLYFTATAISSGAFKFEGQPPHLSFMVGKKRHRTCLLDLCQFLFYVLLFAAFRFYRPSQYSLVFIPRPHKKWMFFTQSGNWLILLQWESWEKEDCGLFAFRYMHVCVHARTPIFSLYFQHFNLLVCVLYLLFCIVYCQFPMILLVYKIHKYNQSLKRVTYST